MMNRRHCLLYVIVSFLSFNMTLMLSMLFYSPSYRSNERHRRQELPMALPAADDEDAQDNGDNWDEDEVKRRAVAAAAAAAAVG